MLTKIFGVYEISHKNSSGKAFKRDVLVMENLFYDRSIKKVYDLKGSMRNRFARTTGQSDDVFLGQNLLEG